MSGCSVHTAGVPAFFFFAGILVSFVLVAIVVLAVVDVKRAVNGWMMPRREEESDETDETEETDETDETRAVERARS